MEISTGSTSEGPSELGSKGPKVNPLNEDHRKWDFETDVLVLGYGGAGACAAIAAHDKGADVLIIEKAPFGGGNTGCSVGTMRLPNNVTDAIEYYRALSFGTVSDENLIRAFAKVMVGLPVKLEEWDIKLKLIKENTPAFPSLPGSHCIDHWSAGLGEALFKTLANNIGQRGIKVLYKTLAKKLIQDPETKCILGVIAESEGVKRYIKANRGVILATGGYQNNFEMQGNYNFPGLRLYPFGTPYNTGDGIKMASEVGADQWHFVSAEFLGVAIKAPTEECGVAIAFMSSSGSFIYVNRYGKNFIDESKNLIHRKEPLEFTYFDHERAEYPNIPFFCIFDENFRKKGPLYKLSKSRVGYASVHGLDEWSNDNSREIKKGWIIQADTIEELARKAEIDTGGLKETVNRYNKQCKEGKSTDFGRPGGQMKAIEAPPFYAVELCLSIINTQGGPKHNSKAQTMDMEGKPIPRLYTPGELGSFFGHLYQGGSNLPEALAFGRIAGETAAAERPW